MFTMRPSPDSLLLDTTVHQEMSVALVNQSLLYPQTVLHLTIGFSEDMGHRR